MNVYPNPTAGNFELSLYGKIYGNIHTKIYNALGQIVYQTDFIKKYPQTTQTISDAKLNDGIYLLELRSSDNQKLTTRIIVYH